MEIKSKFPNGFNNGVSIRDIPILNTHSGKVFWVSSNTGSNGNPGTPQQPFSTIDYAIGRCTASRGDVIFVKEGHAETISAAGQIAIDVIGVKIIGCGFGNDRPTLTFSATDATITMSAASCTLANVVLVASIDSVVSPIVVSAAGCTIDIESRDGSSAIEFVGAILTTSAADKLRINAKHLGFAAGDAMTKYISLIGVHTADINVDFFGKASTAVVNMLTTACDDIRVTGRFYNESAALTKNVVNSTTSTWSVKGFDAKGAYEFVGSDDTAVYAYQAGSLAASATFVPTLGYRVTKTENINTATGVDLFTITGKVLITGWFMECTNAFNASPTDYKIRVKTANVDLCAATNLGSLALGGVLQMNGDAGDTLLNSYAVTDVKTADTNGKGMANRLVGLAGGTDTVQSLRTAGASGDELIHVVYYWPLEASAAIAAA